ncbi:MAG: DUF433 domain-containing protein [Bifidobacteriaceae bacterium]|jgi:uncharacterized protein (DUF433 family)|nr:DUF433 domain-containing protein [Bifidobacteriaceae bacterium]
MTSDPGHGIGHPEGGVGIPPPTGRHLVFLDADVLAAPMTRTLILISSTTRGARFWPRWSLAVEAASDRHRRPGQASLGEVRGTGYWDGGGVIVPDAADSGGTAPAPATHTESTPGSPPSHLVLTARELPGTCLPTGPSETLDDAGGDSSGGARASRTARVLRLRGQGRRPPIAKGRTGRGDQPDSLMAFERISADPRRMGGLPCIGDTGVTVSAVLEQLAAGRSHGEIMADYPYLVEDDIRAALAFAAAAARERELPLLAA